ncbi:MAG TPA: hypothetical protein VGC00_01925 [Thermoanaerobaculia bacterium]
MRRAPRPAPATESGFSLIELVISMLIAIEILIAAAIAFDIHNKVASVQVQITDLQQSMRVAQYDINRTLRTAGRGSLPFDLRPNADFDETAAIPAVSGIAIEVRNNVTGDARYVARGDNTSPQAIAGSDILTVRGCIAGTAYQIDPSTFEWDADDNGVGDSDAVLSIPDTSVAGLAQPLGPLVQEIQVYAAAPRGRMALVSPTALQVYAVADIVSMVVNGLAANPTSVDLTLDLDNASPINPVNLNAVGYDPTAPELSRMYPPEMTVALVCFLEEYRYYVREVAGDALTPLRPRLTRARFEPGTELPYLGQAQSFSLDLADGIFDVQVALGLDTDFTVNGFDATVPGSYNDDSDWIDVDDVIFEADPYDEAQNGDADDWLYNDTGDAVDAIQYTTHSFDDNAGNPVQVYFVRVSVAGRTARLDRSYQAPELDTRADGDWIEDHNLDANPGLNYNSGDALKHRRRVLQAIVDMRNV